MKLPSHEFYRRLPPRRRYTAYTERQKRLGFRLLLTVSGWVLWIVVRLWLSTCRVQVIGWENYRRFQGGGAEGGFIYAGWHRNIPFFFWMAQGLNGCIMASRSDDGQIAAELIRRAGCNPVSGSSSSGGREALAELEQRVREGYFTMFLADGPKGPPEECKMGCLRLAQKTGRPILALQVGAERSWRLKSWDRMVFPKPFSRVVIRYGDPIYIPAEASPEAMERLRREVTEYLQSNQQEADSAFAAAAGTNPLVDPAR